MKNISNQKKTKFTKLDSKLENRNGKNRRKLLTTSLILGGLGATKGVPSSWTKPLVQSIVLPAHALTTDPVVTTPAPQTTITTQPPAMSTAPAGCYNVTSQFLDGASFFWMGGHDESPLYYDSPNCDGGDIANIRTVVAASRDEAVATLGQQCLDEGSDLVIQDTNPALENGLNFYICND